MVRMRALRKTESWRSRTAACAGNWLNRARMRSSRISGSLGLGYVVVGSAFQALISAVSGADAVIIRIGMPRVFDVHANAPAEFVAAHSGQVVIDQNQIGERVAERRQGLLRRAGDGNLPALFLEQQAAA